MWCRGNVGAGANFSAAMETPTIAIGIIIVVAVLAVGAWFMFGGDDKPSAVVCGLDAAPVDPTERTEYVRTHCKAQHRCTNSAHTANWLVNTSVPCSELGMQDAPASAAPADRDFFCAAGGTPDAVRAAMVGKCKGIAKRGVVVPDSAAAPRGGGGGGRGRRAAMRGFPSAAAQQMAERRRAPERRGAERRTERAPRPPRSAPAARVPEQAPMPQGEVVSSEIGGTRNPARPSPELRMAKKMQLDAPGIAMARNIRDTAIAMYNKRSSVDTGLGMQRAPLKVQRLRR
jgi:hypothetical protein